MKKLLLTLITLLFAFSLVSCASEEHTEAPASAPAAADPAPAKAADPAPKKDEMAPKKDEPKKDHKKK